MRNKPKHHCQQCELNYRRHAYNTVMAAAEHIGKRNPSSEADDLLFSFIVLTSRHLSQYKDKATKEMLNNITQRLETINDNWNNDTPTL